MCGPCGQNLHLKIGRRRKKSNISRLLVPDAVDTLFQLLLLLLLLELLFILATAVRRLLELLLPLSFPFFSPFSSLLPLPFSSSGSSLLSLRALHPLSTLSSLLCLSFSSFPLLFSSSQPPPASCGKKLIRPLEAVSEKENKNFLPAKGSPTEFKFLHNGDIQMHDI